MLQHEEDEEESEKLQERNRAREEMEDEGGRRSRKRPRKEDANRQEETPTPTPEQIPLREERSNSKAIGTERDPLPPVGEESKESNPETDKLDGRETVEGEEDTENGGRQDKPEEGEMDTLSPMLNEDTISDMDDTSEEGEISDSDCTVTAIEDASTVNQVPHPYVTPTRGEPPKLVKKKRRKARNTIPEPRHLQPQNGNYKWEG
ncbi:protein lin-25-like [Physella acuta]|uniref:protein lin-25-like n=1 Tax=Physella acuta TaxID=109671 RepID=UPI0027DB73C9|nr:protein lin-25-like [Physella acuta]